jgi:hypothetical protein
MTMKAGLVIRVVGLEQAVDRSLGDKIAFGIGEHHCQLTRRQFRPAQGQFDDPLAHLLGDAVPDPLRSWAVLEGINTARQEPVIPAVEGGAGKGLRCIKPPFAIFDCGDRVA